MASWAGPRWAVGAGSDRAVEKRRRDGPGGRKEEAAGEKTGPRSRFFLFFFYSFSFLFSVLKPCEFKFIFSFDLNYRGE